MIVSARHLARRALVLLTTVAVAGCSSDDSDASCVRAGEAEVCADGTVGSVEMSAQGLQPGSDLRLATADLGSANHAVGADGELEGTVGMLGGDSTAALVIEVSGTTADGECDRR